MELLTSLDSGTFQQVFLAYQDMILPLLESSAKFVKKIPGFRSLPLTDQINLLKHGSFPVATLLVSINALKYVTEILCLIPIRILCLHRFYGYLTYTAAITNFQNEVCNHRYLILGK